MAESKQQKGFDDQEDETLFQSGQASFILEVITQIRETATLLLESNLNEGLAQNENNSQFCAIILSDIYSSS